ncbi:ribonuclease Z [Candidatus Pacearchaeota archaeon]|nr:ribonuclease Z [Candidatus Pacearchaeota archaeon]
MKIPITFLGTGQAIPTAKRNHTSILLQYKDENILIDCGEGTQRQFRIAKLNPCNLTKLLITHWHGDHILGIPGLLQTLALNGYSKTLEIYGPRGTEQYIDMILGMFTKQGNIKINIHEVSSGKIFENEDFEIQTEEMLHGAPCLAYSFIQKEKLRINKEKLKKYKLEGSIIGELQKGRDIIWNNKKIKSKELTYLQEKKKITFVLDTAINPNAIKLAENSDLLVTESTYTENEKVQAKDYLHLTAKQAGEIAKKSKSKRLILTHLSQRYEYKEKLVLNEAKKVFKNSEVAHDFMKVEV